MLGLNQQPFTNSCTGENGTNVVAFKMRFSIQIEPKTQNFILDLGPQKSQKKIFFCHKK